MNWADTIGQYIHAKMIDHALNMRPYTDLEKLEQSIARTSLSVGITRDSIADVLQAELESIAMLRALGDTGFTIDFMAGLVAAEKLVRYGKHVTDEA